MIYDTSTTIFLFISKENLQIFLTHYDIWDEHYCCLSFLKSNVPRALAWANDFVFCQAGYTWLYRKKNPPIFLLIMTYERAPPLSFLFHCKLETSRESGSIWSTKNYGRVRSVDFLVYIYISNSFTFATWQEKRVAVCLRNSMWAAMKMPHATRYTFQIKAADRADRLWHHVKLSCRGMEATELSGDAVNGMPCWVGEHDMGMSKAARRFLHSKENIPLLPDCVSFLCPMLFILWDPQGHASGSGFLATLTHFRSIVEDIELN